MAEFRYLPLMNQTNDTVNATTELER